MQLEYQVNSGDFANAGKVSSEIKKILKQLSFSTSHIKRIVVALYEAEVNVVAHSYGGSVSCHIAPDKVRLDVIDTGPGIADVELAMTEGWSTATQEVREMGFGAGMGLSNIKKNCDYMSIDSGKDKPTHMTLIFEV
ncbi:MAG: ATP-binding protein [Sphaerochaetaceae bacterium]|jgi:serine/threonine-protein kinase RsbT